MDYLFEYLKKHGSQAKLLYKGSKSGWMAQDFHTRCDNKGKTLTFMLTDKGIICGGYTSLPWQQDGGDKEDQTAFIFSLNPRKIFPNN
jgi:TLD